MIKSNQPLSMAEAKEYAKKNKTSGAEVIGFINKFSELKFKDALELGKKLEDLKMMKLKKEHIVKIIDLMPENQESLNKVFTDVSLDEDENKKILETVKEFK